MSILRHPAAKRLDAPIAEWPDASRGSTKPLEEAASLAFGPFGSKYARVAADHAELSTRCGMSKILVSHGTRHLAT